MEAKNEGKLGEDQRSIKNLLLTPVRGAILVVIARLIAVIDFIGSFEPIRAILTFVTFSLALWMTISLVSLQLLLEIWTRYLGRSIKWFGGVSYKIFGPTYYGYFLGVLTFIWCLHISSLLFPVESPKFIFDKLNYLLIVDATDRMKESFPGSGSKWEAATETLTSYLDLVPETAEHGLILIGGNNSTSPNSCSNPTTVELPVAPRQLDEINNRITHASPQGQGSLTSAVKLAMEEMQRKVPADEAVILYILLGGGEDCASNESSWKPLINTLNQAIGGRINISANIILLATEGVDVEIANDANVYIKRLGVSNIQVFGVQDKAELDSSINASVAQEATAIAAVYPTQVATVRAAQSTNTGNTQPTVPGILNPVPNTPNSSQNSNQSQTVPPITLTYTATTTPTITSTITRTFSPTPTNTSTPVPPTFTFTPLPGLPNSLQILYPSGGFAFNCPTSQECIQTVTVQWVYDWQQQQLGQYMSIWVRPIPTSEDQQYFVQQAPSHIGNGQWQSNSVYIGRIGDPENLAFRIVVLITDQIYVPQVPTTGQYLLPEYLQIASIDVTR